MLEGECLLLGRHDREAPSAVAERYFQALRAPHKALVWFERSAHFLNVEEAETFNRFPVDRLLAEARSTPAASPSALHLQGARPHLEPAAVQAGEQQGRVALRAARGRAGRQGPELLHPERSSEWCCASRWARCQTSARTSSPVAERCVSAHQHEHVGRGYAPPRRRAAARRSGPAHECQRDHERRRCIRPRLPPRWRPRARRQHRRNPDLRAAPPCTARELHPEAPLRPGKPPSHLPSACPGPAFERGPGRAGRGRRPRRASPAAAGTAARRWRFRYRRRRRPRFPAPPPPSRLSPPRGPARGAGRRGSRPSGCW